MSLAGVYHSALQNQYGYPKGWVASWLPGQDHPLGAVGRINNEMFIRNSTLGSKGVDVAPDPDPGPPAGPLTLQTNKEIKWSFATDASLPDWEWIGNAKAGMKIAFGDQKGIVLGVANSRFERFLDIDALKPKLLDLAGKGDLVPGDAVVVERQLADSGLLCMSEGKRGEAAVTASAGIKPGATLSVVDFAADMKVSSASSAVALQAFPQGLVLAFRVLKLGTRGFWWWKHIVVRAGAKPQEARLSEEINEKKIPDEDYFAFLG